LSALFLPEELIELRFIETWIARGKKRSCVARAAEWARRADVVASYADLREFASGSRANIFFGVCPRSRRGDSSDISIGTIRCAWCDMDDVSVDEAWARWSRAGVAHPSAVVISGSGVHGYWLLERDLVAADERARFVGMLPYFYADFGGDHVQNISRMMRVPGTLNYKDARNGRPPKPCTLCVCEANARYPLEAFSRWFEQAAKARSDEEGRNVRTIATRLSGDEARAREAEVADIARRLDLPTGDRSRRDFAVICELLRLGLTKEEIWNTVSGRSKFATAGRRYFDRTMTSAERIVLRDGMEEQESSA